MTRDEAIAEIDRRQREDTPPQPGCVPVLLSSTTEPGGYTVEWRGTGVVLDDPIHGPAPVCPDCGQVIGETELTVRRVRPWGIAHERCPREPGRLVMTSDAPRIPHCTHWEEGDGKCHRCGLPNWCTDLGEDDPASHHAYYDAPSCRSNEGMADAAP